ncbi:NgoBV family restriction endonuclease [uncultured Clostridium sp.]|uniref:NgoBV family restriction endonuclease n=1 Tax=uncultured Clostridium sp. TaxID=59620 RepID=UPI002588186A|nr:NgoBV family restriction endonuclease [uncultured Clostridium sp.]
MPRKLNAQQIYDELLSSDILSLTGYITFHLGDTEVQINTTDTVGLILQAWLKTWFINNDIYFHEPDNTQKFPDFFLNDVEPHKNMLEVKAFNCSKSPAFDIANFDSYCDSLKSNPSCLDANYLIFGYAMNDEGLINIDQIWLKKIWEIAGKSSKYPLKTQVKKGVIYNIRPNSQFKKGKKTPFSNDHEFVLALYNTIKKYRSDTKAYKWLKKFTENLIE